MNVIVNKWIKKNVIEFSFSSCVRYCNEVLCSVGFSKFFFAHSCQSVLLYVYYIHNVSKFLLFYVEKGVIIEKKVCGERVLHKFEIAFLKKNMYF